MSTESHRDETESVSPEGARRATGGDTDSGAENGLGPGQRWSRRRKMEAVLRILRGESLDAVSRDVGVEIYRLEEWRDQALAGMEEALRPKPRSAAQMELEKAQKLLGEAMMEVELLRAKCRKGNIPLPLGRLGR
jgi:transposase